MIYILDSNIFIEAKNIHLPFDRCPLFWNWLIELAEKGLITIPEEVYKEITAGNDQLATWMAEHKNVLVNPYAVFSRIGRVMEEGYGAIDEATLEKLKADPWVIAHASAVGGTVVTSEKPGRHTIPYNKQIPSVCKTLQIPCCTITTFLWQMRSTLPE